MDSTYGGSLYKANPQSRAQIEKKAYKLRELLGIGKDLWVDVIHILENVMPILDEKFYPDIVPDHELDAHARAFPDNHTIKIRESVYDGARRGFGRDRYTVMHEIYHFMWHESAAISLARNPDDVPRYENPEWQADVFAGAFLMPRHLIKGKTEEQVMHECGVSRSAARYQLRLK